jgi:hypothetical protein
VRVGDELFDLFFESTARFHAVIVGRPRGQVKSDAGG